MVEPTYVHVGESQKGITVVVTRCSKHAHIVRAGGVFRPDKVSNIQEIDKLEIRADPAETAVAYTLPQPLPLLHRRRGFLQYWRGLKKEHTAPTRRHRGSTQFCVRGDNIDLDIAYSQLSKE
jgi:hypothetical protein